MIAKKPVSADVTRDMFNRQFAKQGLQELKPNVWVRNFLASCGHSWRRHSRFCADTHTGWQKGELTAGSSYGYPLAGGNLELTRTWTVNLQSQVRYPITQDYDLLAGINYHYESGGYLDITSIPWPDLSRFDATFGVAHGGASLVAYVNNAFDSRPPEFVYGNRATTLVDGATYGMRFSFKY